MAFPANHELITPTDPRYGLIWINPARVSGTPCFHNTRVPIQTLWDYLESGKDVGTFLDHFEGVTLEQVLGVLRLAQQRLIEPGKAA